MNLCKNFRSSILLLALMASFSFVCAEVVHAQADIGDLQDLVPDGGGGGGGGGVAPNRYLRPVKIECDPKLESSTGCSNCGVPASVATGAPVGVTD